MNNSKIGEINLGKFKTEIYATESIKKKFKSEKISLSNLIPPAWLWYDNELLDVIDENGDGKPDNKFGTNFRIIYSTNPKDIKEMEQKALLISETTIKNIKLKYVGLKA
jgi:hypothetical protein